MVMTKRVDWQDLGGFAFSRGDLTGGGVWFGLVWFGGFSLFSRGDLMCGGVWPSMAKLSVPATR